MCGCPLYSQSIIPSQVVGGCAKYVYKYRQFVSVLLCRFDVRLCLKSDMNEAIIAFDLFIEW